MSSIWHTPKVQLVITLLLIFSVALMITAPSGKIFLLLASVGFATFFDLLFTFIRKRGVFFPYAAIVTGMIIALIIDPNAFWYQIAVVSAIAMGTKNFLRVTGRHVFNPAAIGLLIGGILFHQYAAWWGVSFQKPVVFILLLPALISGIRLRRLPTIITFLIANILFTQQPFLSRIFDPVTLFFATVMLPEPMTTPFNPKRQILYGLTVAVIIQLISYLINIDTNPVFLPDLYIPALLLGNILFFKYR